MCIVFMLLVLYVWYCCEELICGFYFSNKLLCLVLQISVFGGQFMVFLMIMV
jgi:hypothetical protein